MRNMHSSSECHARGMAPQGQRHAALHEPPCPCPACLHACCSWNYFRCSINETIIKEVADAIVSSGLRDAGYVYVNIGGRAGWPCACLWPQCLPRSSCRRACDVRWLMCITLYAPAAPGASARAPCTAHRRSSPPHPPPSQERSCGGPPARHARERAGREQPRRCDLHPQHALPSPTKP